MNRMENLDEDSLLHTQKQQGPFPMEILKHVEKPTNTHHR